MAKMPRIKWGWLAWLVFGGVLYYLGSIDLHFVHLELFPIVLIGVTFMLLAAFWWLGDR